MTRFVAQKQRRLAALFLGCMLASFLFAFLPSAQPTAKAQDDNGAASDEGKKAAEPSKPAEQPKQSSNIFTHIISSLSWFAPIMLIVSIALIALIMLLIMELRLVAAIPPGFVEDFTDTVNKRRFKEAFEMAKEDGSFLGRVMTTGMSRLQYGIDDAREAAFNMVESVKASKNQLITYLATIGTLGPMLGLVGTVWGMILSFMELGKGGSPNPATLASGISHALVVTLVGIALSVPAIFFHAFFHNRLIRISMDVGNIADDLLTQMYHNSRKPAPPEAAATAPDPRVPTAAIKPK